MIECQPSSTPDKFSDIPHPVLFEIGKASLAKLSIDTLTLSERAPFEHGLAASNELYKRINVAPPALEAFEQSGIDLNRLSQRWMSMMRAGLCPVALFAKADVSSEETRALFANLRADTDIPNNPLKRQEKPIFKTVDGERKRSAHINDGIALNGGIVRSWSRITTPTHPQEVIDGWTLRLVAGRSEAPEYGRAPQSSRHITLSEYLTLQGILIQSGEPPVDQDEPIWLGSGGTFIPELVESPRAVVGKWDSEAGHVFIGHDPIEQDGIPTVNHIRPARS